MATLISLLPWQMAYGGLLGVMVNLRNEDIGNGNFFVSTAFQTIHFSIDTVRYLWMENTLKYLCNEQDFMAVSTSIQTDSK